MASLKTLVEQYIGTVDKLYLLDHLLNESLVNILATMPAERLILYATQLTSTVNGELPFRGNILSVNVDGRKAKVVEVSLSEATKDENSIYKAHPLFPAVWVKDSTIYSEPEGTIKATCIQPPVINGDTVVIQKMPYGSEEIAVLYACHGLLKAKVMDLDIPEIGELPQEPTAPNAPDFNYSDAVAGTIGAINISNLPTFQGYISPSFSPPSFPSIENLVLPEFPSINISDPNVDYLNAVAGVIGDINISTLPVFEGYVKPELTKPTFPLVANLSLPSAPTLSGISEPSFVYQDANVTIPSLTTIGSLPELDEYDDEGVIALFDFPIIEGNIGNAEDQLDVKKWFSVIGKLIENEEDPELASQAIQKIQSYLSSLNASMQNRMNKFQSATVSYNAGVQRIIEQARLEANRQSEIASLETNTELQNKSQKIAYELQNYAMRLERFSKELDVYRMSVETAVQLWTANEIQLKFNKYFQELQLALEEFVSEQANENNRVQAYIQSYQAEVQKILEQSRIDLSRITEAASLETNVDLQNKLQKAQFEIQNYSLSLEKASREVDYFRAETEAKIQAWSTNELQLKYNKFFEEYQIGLQDFAARQSNEANRVQAYIQNYQSEVQKIIEEARLEFSRLQTEATMATEVNLQNEIQKLATAIQRYQLTLQNFESKMSVFSAEFQKVMSVYQSEYAVFQEKRQNIMGLAGQFYAKYMDKLNKLNFAQYESSGNDRAGAPPEPDR